MPVAPWMRLRAVQDVWAAWLRGLRALWLSSVEGVAVGQSGSALLDWEAWQDQHVHALNFRRAAPGAVLLAELLTDPRMTGTEAHLIGHSVGGATVLRYLMGVRAGHLPAPTARVRTAITLDAAISGIAGLWSGVDNATRQGETLHLLGAWARQHGISVLTISNERDIWSHRAVADLPYVGLRLGPPLDVGAQLNGAIHGWLRRMPQVVEALWLDPEPAPLTPSAATPVQRLS
jgi:alpha-beta hydrolase superfamily lysophospholipase